MHDPLRSRSEPRYRNVTSSGRTQMTNHDTVVQGGEVTIRLRIGWLRLVLPLVLASVPPTIAMMALIDPRKIIGSVEPIVLTPLLAGAWGLIVGLAYAARRPPTSEPSVQIQGGSEND